MFYYEFIDNRWVFPLPEDFPKMPPPETSLDKLMNSRRARRTWGRRYSKPNPGRIMDLSLELQAQRRADPEAFIQEAIRSQPNTQYDLMGLLLSDEYGWLLQPRTRANICTSIIQSYFFQGPQNIEFHRKRDAFVDLNASLSVPREIAEPTLVQMLAWTADQCPPDKLTWAQQEAISVQSQRKAYNPDAYEENGHYLFHSLFDLHPMMKALVRNTGKNYIRETWSHEDKCFLSGFDMPDILLIEEERATDRWHSFFDNLGK